MLSWQAWWWGMALNNIHHVWYYLRRGPRVCKPTVYHISTGGKLIELDIKNLGKALLMYEKIYIYENQS